MASNEECSLIESDHGGNWMKCQARFLIFTLTLFVQALVTCA